MHASICTYCDVVVWIDGSVIDDGTVSLRQCDFMDVIFFIIYHGADSVAADDERPMSDDVNVDTLTVIISNPHARNEAVANGIVIAMNRSSEPLFAISAPFK